MAYRAKGWAVFLLGFGKNDLDNISPDQLRTFRAIGANWLAAGAAVARQAIDEGALQEIDHDEQT